MVDIGADPVTGKRRLTTTDVENLVDHLLTAGRKRGGKPGTGLAVDAIAAAVSVECGGESAPAGVEPSSAGEMPAQVRTARQPWSEREVKTFLASVAGQRLHAIMLLSLLGLRPAETCGLRWTDIDFDEGMLTVETTRTLVMGDGGMTVVEKAPKTASGRRSLPLPARVIAALRTFKALQAAEQLPAGPAYTATGYVLVAELGAPQRTDWLRRQTYKAVAAANVRKVRPYDARHACLTYLTTNGGARADRVRLGGSQRPEHGATGLRASPSEGPGAGPQRAHDPAQLREINQIV